MGQCFFLEKFFWCVLGWQTWWSHETHLPLLNKRQWLVLSCIYELRLDHWTEHFLYFNVHNAKLFPLSKYYENLSLPASLSDYLKGNVLMSPTRKRQLPGKPGERQSIGREDNESPLRFTGPAFSSNPEMKSFPPPICTIVLFYFIVLWNRMKLAPQCSHMERHPKFLSGEFSWFFFLQPTRRLSNLTCETSDRKKIMSSFFPCVLVLVC